ncbi:MAG: hypothetical protein DYH18_06745 [Xanthomonadales bacterium PRO7]|jgi:hypothetical protein|nr:hypothetical protein [Xanthomonadales bacterium PRO7]HMM56870.1 hypothetical protein [Rudaea sp.]
MKHRVLAIVGGAAVAAFALGQVAQAETLLMKRVREERGMNAPHRGMSMAQVERRFGAPTAKLSPAGGDAPRHPVINRWEYPNYIVYFEHSTVIDSVAVHATPGEIGPKSQ